MADGKRSALLALVLDLPKAIGQILDKIRGSFGRTCLTVQKPKPHFTGISRLKWRREWDSKSVPHNVNLSVY